jgi:predicted nucleotidyltransferase
LPDEDIFVYQKITKILEKLTDNIEADMEERFRSLNRAFDATSQSVESMGLQAKHLQMDMEKAGTILRNDLRHAVQVCRS